MGKALKAQNLGPKVCADFGIFKSFFYRVDTGFWFELGVGPTGNSTSRPQQQADSTFF